MDFTRQFCHQFLPLITAYAVGKKLQYRRLGCDAWKDVPDREDPVFGDSGVEYRIKPEPKLRPWKPEEVPVGALIRKKGAQLPGVITDVDGLDIFIGQSGSCTFHQALENCEYSMCWVNKVWEPCGVEDEEQS
jgi:hypothetical protein